MFARATDFLIQTLTVDGRDIKDIFFALEIFEHIDSSAITGTLTVVETASNQFLATYGIEGNEPISIEIESCEEGYFAFDGFVNRVANRTVASNGQSVYNLEIVSPIVRANEQVQITKKFKQQTPDQIILEVLGELSNASESAIKNDKFEGKGQPMNFIASLWHPVRTIKYVIRHGVPVTRGGTTTAIDAFFTEIEKGEGTGGFLLWETLKGMRYGSSVELMSGKMGDKIENDLLYTLANQNEPPSITRDYILSYNNVQNNDTQSQQRSGGVKSKLISYDLDQGVYREQIWESPFATEKQKQANKIPTRTFTTTLNPEKWGEPCYSKPIKINQDDKSLLSIQQSAGTLNNIIDNVCNCT